MMRPYLFALLGLTLLSGCGDDLSAVPDPETKVPGVEPDAFSFVDATLVDIGSRTYPTRIYSTVPAGQTRYYKLRLEYFDACSTLGCLRDLTLVSSTDVLTLAWYDEAQQEQYTDPAYLSFSGTSSYFTGCYDCKHDFYITVNNATAADVDYQLRFGFYN